MKMHCRSFWIYVHIVVFVRHVAYVSSICNSDICPQPLCYCKSTTIPFGFDGSDTPQMVMLTLDDAINPKNFDLYSSLFEGKVNPNGCPILGTFYVSHEDTDYWMVQKLYAKGHEIATHSISHRVPIEWWKNAVYDDWYEEIEGQRKMLQKWADIDIHEIRGMRAPYLQGGGNTQFQVIKDLGPEGFQYDASLLSYNHLFPPYPPPVWPYTMDHPVLDECGIGPCPDWSQFGVWEIPMVQYSDLDGRGCAMLEDCDRYDASEEDAYQLLLKNFEVHYYNNKAPFGIYTHTQWLSNDEHVRALQSFIDDMLSNGDVWFVTGSQVIDWMKSPTTLSDINNFESWDCWSKTPRWVCDESATTVCEFDSDNNFVSSSGRSKRSLNVTNIENNNEKYDRRTGRFGYMTKGDLKDKPTDTGKRGKRQAGAEHSLRTCVIECPDSYPWLSNIEGK